MFTQSNCMRIALVSWPTPGYMAAFSGTSLQGPIGGTSDAANWYDVCSRRAVARLGGRLRHHGESGRQRRASRLAVASAGAVRRRRQRCELDDARLAQSAGEI